MYKESETRVFNEVINDKGEAVPDSAEVGTVINHVELGQVNLEQAKLDGGELKTAAAKKAEEELKNKFKWPK